MENENKCPKCNRRLYEHGSNKAYTPEAYCMGTDTADCKIAIAQARIAQLEAESAALREAVELSVYRLCVGDGYYSQRIAEVMPKLREALSTTAGADLLKRLRELEESSEPMRSTLEWVKENLLEDIARGEYSEFGEHQALEVVTAINDALGIKEIANGAPVVPDEGEY